MSEIAATTKGNKASWLQDLQQSEDIVQRALYTKGVAPFKPNARFARPRCEGQHHSLYYAKASCRPTGPQRADSDLPSGKPRFAVQKIQPMGCSGRREKIKAPTAGDARISIPPGTVRAMK
jgi:hypothetical protein